MFPLLYICWNRSDIYIQYDAAAYCHISRQIGVLTIAAHYDCLKLHQAQKEVLRASQHLPCLCTRQPMHIAGVVYLG